ncbi:MAG: PH domain-containing protein [Methanomassiliicoccales archaeon]|nr:PH domain-containing protein [Methanomassiliicoccales archaeon]
MNELRERLRMENEPRERIDPRAFKVWAIGGSITYIGLFIAALIFYVLLTDVPEAPAWVGWAAVLLAMAYGPWGIIIAPWLRMRFWRYEVREKEMEIQHGIFIIKRHLIPMVRVQHVDTEHGPLMRYFGLTTLYVSTAATRFPIPALPRQRAEELRGEIATLAGTSEEDV